MLTPYYLWRGCTKSYKKYNTGKINVANNNVEITNNLAVNGTTNLQNLITDSFVLANNLNISNDLTVGNNLAVN